MGHGREVDLQVIESLLAFTIVVAFVLALRHWKVLSSDDVPRFSRLLIKVVLPVVVASELIVIDFNVHTVLLIVAMYAAGLSALAVTWVVARLLRLDRGKTGALMIASSFGSSALLGFPLVSFAFPGDTQALADVVVVSVLGVGLPLYTVCPLLAMYYGGTEQDRRSMLHALRTYLVSPLWFAVVIGVVLAFVPLEVIDSPFAEPFVTASKMVAGAMSLLAALVLGLQLKRVPLRGFWPLILISAATAMVVQPFTAQLAAMGLGFGARQQDMAVLIAAMPSAVLGTVFAAQYDCDGPTTSALTFVNILLAPLLVPLVFALLT